MTDLKFLVKIFEKTKTSQEMEKLILALFTPREVEEFVQRLKIVSLLLEGVSQREISQTLGVGIATVTRGSRELQYGQGEILKKLLKKT